MRFVKIAIVAGFAAAMLSGCCSSSCGPKCYPYPLYDFSPARVCNNPCAQTCVPCAPAPAPCVVKVAKRCK